MLILGIDTSTAQVAVAIGDGGQVRGHAALTGGRRHAEQLAPAIRYLCDETGVGLHQLAALAVGTGPGLFTGLRVGVTTAKVMAQALRVPVVGIPSLDLVAYPLRHGTKRVVTVLDARRNEVFHATYRPVPGGIQRDSEYSVGSVRDLVADLDATGQDVLLAGDGAVRYREELETLDHVEFAGPAFDTPSVSALVELATARAEREEFSTPWEIEPLYLRQSDAELSFGAARTADGVTR